MITKHPRFAIRTIKRGCVQIRGRLFRVGEYHQPYTGELDGQRWVFGLYWGPRDYDRYDSDGLASFVFLWGTEQAYREINTYDPSYVEPNCINGVYHWQWWYA